MKILIVGLLLCQMQVFAQVENTQGRVFYAFSHVKDTNQRNTIYKEDMMLDFTSEASIYKSYTYFFNDSIQQARFRQNPSTNINYNVPKATSEQVLHLFGTNERFIIRPWMGDTLLIKDPTEQISWILMKDSKSIAGFNCNLANGWFKGRRYFAWFTTEIPVQAGPWKLNGLPGLILEAYDSTASIKFELTSIQNLKTLHRIGKPLAARVISMKDWEEIRQAVLNNPEAYLNAQLNARNNGSGSGKATITRTTPPSKGGKTTAVTNNPLELKE